MGSWADRRLCTHSGDTQSSFESCSALLRRVPLALMFHVSHPLHSYALSRRQQGVPFPLLLVSAQPVSYLPRAIRRTRMIRMMVGLMGRAALISISSSVMPMTDSSTMARSSWFHLHSRAVEAGVGIGVGLWNTVAQTHQSGRQTPCASHSYGAHYNVQIPFLLPTLSGISESGPFFLFYKELPRLKKHH